MMSPPEALLLVGVFVYFLFGEVQIVFKVPFCPRFFTTKTQVKMPQKCKMANGIKITREDTHELLNFI